MNIGIFGGTFDPPHIGHLIAAQDACTALALDRMLFVPAAQPPHKAGSALTPADVRVEMLRAATLDNAAFEVSTIELERPGPSYTIDTLRTIRGTVPGASLLLLVGIDQAREFRSWREPDEILQLAELVVLSRAGTETLAGEAGFMRHWRTVKVTRIDVSSTLIRAKVASAEPIRYLVPDAVAAIIERAGLYRPVSG